MTYPPQPPAGSYPPPQQPQPGAYPAPGQPQAPQGGAYPPPQPQAGYYAPQPSPAGPVGPAYPAPGQGYQPFPASPAADIEQNKVYAVLAYLGILVLIPIFAAKQSPFARYHANQGLILAIPEIAFAILSGILLGIIKATADPWEWAFTGPPAAFTVVSALSGLVYLVFLGFTIIGIINAVQGQFKPLPGLGNIRILK